jgi:class 3 adenylate cyclase/CHASE3 domain sensor protein
MRIRAKLGLAFVLILLLYALNLIITFWGNERRERAVNALLNASERERLIVEIMQETEDQQKQITVMGAIYDPAMAVPMLPEHIQRLRGQLASIVRRIEHVARLTDESARPPVHALGEAFAKLTTTWMVFHENFGTAQHQKAVVELAVNGDPLSQTITREVLPKLRDDERRRVEEATLNFSATTELTDRITVLIFAATTLFALAVALVVARQISRGVNALKDGAAQIGSGNLGHRIDVRSGDEMRELARSFNDMAVGLDAAQVRLTQAHEELERRHDDAEKQRRRSESLLLNILPQEIARELEERGEVQPRYFEDVTVLFTDFKGFTASTEKLAAEELVDILHAYFTGFDEVVERYGLEKLKTIGDSYMCVGGLPTRRPSHAVDVVLAAFDMLHAADRVAASGLPAAWQVRIGVHTGPVIAGVVGIRKFAFDIWGDTVNFASRIEATGAPGRICISGRTQSRVKDFFVCEHRGGLRTKDDRTVESWFVTGLLPSLTDDAGSVPPPGFRRRYQVYFQQDPPAYPTYLVERPRQAEVLVFPKEG